MAGGWSWWRKRVPLFGNVVVGGVPLGALTRGVAEHPPQACDTQFACPLHLPSQHALSRHRVYHGSVTNLTVRRCDHDQLHPDPDDMRWGSGWIDHDCDGCCGATLRPGPASG